MIPVSYADLLNREQRESSMLTFETSASRGVEAIVEKLTVCCPLAQEGFILIRRQSLPFEKVAHKVNTLDAQPASDSGAILVMVTGALMVSLSWKSLPVRVTNSMGGT